MKKGMIKIMLGGNGLTVKGGRLINELPNGVMGIQAAADARKMRKREEKISMIAQGYERAEMMSEMSEMMMGKKEEED
jgi:hypothetical protein